MIIAGPVLEIFRFWPGGVFFFVALHQRLPVGNGLWRDDMSICKLSSGSSRPRIGLLRSDLGVALGQSRRPLVPVLDLRSRTVPSCEEHQLLVSATPVGALAARARGSSSCLQNSASLLSNLVPCCDWLIPSPVNASAHRHVNQTTAIVSSDSAQKPVTSQFQDPWKVAQLICPPHKPNPQHVALFM